MRIEEEGFQVLEKFLGFLKSERMACVLDHY